MFGFNARRFAFVTFAAVCGLFTQGFSQDLLYSDMFPLGDVQLLGGPLKERQELNVETLLSYDTTGLFPARRGRANPAGQRHTGSCNC